MTERFDGGISCSEVLEILDDFVDDILDQERTTQVVTHIGSCKNCENFGARYVALVGVLRSDLFKNNDRTTQN